MKFKHALVALAASFALVGTATACEVPDDAGTAADRADTKDAAKEKAKDKKGGKAKGEKAQSAPKETAGQANARESAAQYLDLTGFSREGLINQLVVGDGYSKKDATYGADAQDADWNEQAALSAKQYLDLTAFSRDGLIQQLMVGDKYTREQAEYGVTKVGL